MQITTLKNSHEIPEVYLDRNRIQDMVKTELLFFDFACAATESSELIHFLTSKLFKPGFKIICIIGNYRLKYSEITVFTCKQSYTFTPALIGPPRFC